MTDFHKQLRSIASSGNNKWSKVSIRPFSNLVYSVFFQEVLRKDVTWAIFSLVFVFVYTWFHLGSFYMAFLSILMVTLSYPLSYLFYSGVFRISMNTTLNQITIFLVLGLAADNIFVFCDAWRQSGLLPSIAKDEQRRLAYSFKRAFRAILMTSSTTAVSFLANALSDVRPIRAFGILAAVMIILNFWLVILIMPSIQLTHDRYLKDRCAYSKCCRCCKKGKKQEVTHAEILSTDKDLEPAAS